MEFMEAHIKKIAVLILFVLTTAYIIRYVDSLTNAYEVSINGKTIGYVTDKRKTNDVEKNLEKEEKSYFKDFKLSNKLSFVKVFLESGTYLTEKDIRQTLLLNNNVAVDALELKSDGKTFTYVRNISEKEKLIQLIKEYYMKKSKITNVECVLKSKITYNKVKKNMAALLNIEDTAEKIIAEDKKSINPLIEFKLTGKVVYNKAIEPATTILWSNQYYKGQTVAGDKGTDGLEQVNELIIMKNQQIINKNVIYEKVIKEPKNNTVIYGTKYTDISQLTSYVTSRGSISSGFGMRWGKMHDGIDIAANYGSPIYAVMDGVVNYAGWEDGYGNLIKINNGNGFETLYGHCSVLTVKLGQKISKGDKIGEVGSTGNSTGPHIHFEVRVNGAPKNPANYIGYVSN